MSSDVLTIFMGRIKTKQLSDEEKMHIALRLHQMDENHANIAAKIITSYYSRFDKTKKVIGQEDDDIPYSGKQLEEGLEFHVKMLPTELLLTLNELIKHADSENNLDDNSH